MLWVNTMVRSASPTAGATRASAASLAGVSASSRRRSSMRLAVGPGHAGALAVALGQRRHRSQEGLERLGRHPVLADQAGSQARPSARSARRSTPAPQAENRTPTKVTVKRAVTPSPTARA